MTDITSADTTTGAFDYQFNEQEVKILAKLFRRHQEELPDGILDFATKIERFIYNSMSIDEAAAFYS